MSAQSETPTKKAAKRTRGAVCEPAPFAMPSNDDPEFAALPAAVRRDVRLWAARLARMWHERPITGALTRLARKSRAGFSTATRKYYALRRAGHWRALICRRQLSPGLRTLCVKLPPGGVQVAIVSSTPREVIVQIRPIDAGKVSKS